MTASQNHQPLLSVIMNCYNGEKYLAEAIESVLGQTYENWEIVFWDNQSTDRSAKIFQSYKDPRLRYFYAPTHTVLGEARARVFEKTRGEWIGFLDYDDIWLPDKLARQVAIIAGAPDRHRLGLVYGRANYFDGLGNEGPLLGEYEDRPLPEGRILEKLLLGRNFIPLVSALMLKDACLAIGGIPDEYENGVDYHIFAGIAAYYQVRAVQDVCCKYRVHDSNLTLRLKIKGCEEEIRIIEAWASYATFSAMDKNRKINDLKTNIGLTMMLTEKQVAGGLRYLVANGLVFNSLAFTLRKLRAILSNRRSLRRSCSKRDKP